MLEYLIVGTIIIFGTKAMNDVDESLLMPFLNEQTQEFILEKVDNIPLDEHTVRMKYLISKYNLVRAKFETFEAFQQEAYYEIRRLNYQHALCKTEIDKKMYQYSIFGGGAVYVEKGRSVYAECDEKYDTLAQQQQFDAIEKNLRYVFDEELDSLTKEYKNSKVEVKDRQYNNFFNQKLVKRQIKFDELKIQFNNTPNKVWNLMLKEYHQEDKLLKKLLNE